MNFIIVILAFILFLTPRALSVPVIQNTLDRGSSLSVEKADDILISLNGVFSAGFYQVGDNAYCFAIWFTTSANRATVWMANRDYPVNGRRSRLMLMNNGNLDLSDALQSTVWSSNTWFNSSVHLELKLLDTGNLVLLASSISTLWQSFDFPTDTLLPNQFLTRDLSLVSSRSEKNQSSGYYKLFFDNDNILHLLFDGPLISSEYWPDPDFISWENQRSTYNDSRVAWYDSRGYFTSSDILSFYAADAGLGPPRRLTLDYDGNLRMYSLQKNGGWATTWQAFNLPCNIHGTCGPNNICSYDPLFGRRCTCLEGFRIKNPRDLSEGCEPEFDLETFGDDVHFVELTHAEAHGYDDVYYKNSTIDHCRLVCLSMTNCRAFLFKYIGSSFDCYTKTMLLNMHQSPTFRGSLYVKTRKNMNGTTEPLKLLCRPGSVELLDRHYRRTKNSVPQNLLLWFAGVIGIVEFICIFLVWCIFFRANEDEAVAFKGYVLAGTGFNKFSYAELKKATSNFREEVGKGGSGSVYKGILSDDTVVAIKKLADATQGEAEFLAEMSIIGRLNHMNLIKMWGYCLEGTRRLLVFDFMERGSLAENLYSKSLSWGQRYEIAFGTARGLAYLHEECLEWILHCDMKPQNILLDSDYQAKVADFGRSKLLDRDSTKRASLSRIRGTRGYMAPEWVSNVPISSKVDVYSYGVVMLEVVTGKSPTYVDSQFEAQHHTLVT